MNPSVAQPASRQACADCDVYRAAQLKKLGVNVETWEFVVALAGNPNTGKSTVFNALTGLRQHTGNWPGKTVARAEGGFEYRRQALQAGGPARHVFPAVHQPGRTDRARLHPVRSAGRHGGGGGCHPAGAQPQPGASGARDHRSRRALPESHRRGQPRRYHRGRSPVGAATWACRWCLAPRDRDGDCRSCCRRSAEVARAGGSAVPIASRRTRRPCSPHCTNWSVSWNPPTPACPTPAGWRCGCWAATNMWRRRCAVASWRALLRPARQPAALFHRMNRFRSQPRRRPHPAVAPGSSANASAAMCMNRWSRPSTPRPRASPDGR